MPAITDGRLGETITFRGLFFFLRDEPLSVSDSSELFNSLETLLGGFSSSNSKEAKEKHEHMDTQ